MNRPKTTARDLPPRMLRRVRTLAGGKKWVSYYYNGRNDAGRRKEIPLGGDLNEAKREMSLIYRATAIAIRRIRKCKAAIQ